ncbi:hypothetical protein ACIP93_27905 [Streptomyces sp. NPDC088745]|uniref:hypothetical protein n=1 Tax=Streptomyces sp. NPDC088745 TaxID=3365884 RepID=UPI003822E57E
MSARLLDPEGKTSHHHRILTAPPAYDIHNARTTRDIRVFHLTPRPLTDLLGRC